MVNFSCSLPELAVIASGRVSRGEGPDIGRTTLFPLMGGAMARKYVNRNRASTSVTDEMLDGARGRVAAAAERFRDAEQGDPTAPSWDAEYDAASTALPARCGTARTAPAPRPGPARRAPPATRRPRHWTTAPGASWIDPASRPRTAAEMLYWRPRPTGPRPAHIHKANTRPGCRVRASAW